MRRPASVPYASPRRSDTLGRRQVRRALSRSQLESREWQSQHRQKEEGRASCLRPPARNRVTEKRAIIALLCVFDGLGNRQKVRPVINPRDELGIVSREVVGIHRADARVVLGVYWREPAVRYHHLGSFGPKVAYSRKSRHFIIKPEGAGLLDDVHKTGIVSGSHSRAS